MTHRVNHGSFAVIRSGASLAPGAGGSSASPSGAADRGVRAAPESAGAGEDLDLDQDRGLALPQALADLPVLVFHVSKTARGKHLLYASSSSMRRCQVNRTGGAGCLRAASATLGLVRILRDGAFLQVSQRPKPRPRCTIGFGDTLQPRIPRLFMSVRSVVALALP